MEPSIKEKLKSLMNSNHPIFISKYDVWKITMRVYSMMICCPKRFKGGNVVIKIDISKNFDTLY